MAKAVSCLLVALEGSVDQLSMTCQPIDYFRDVQKNISGAGMISRHFQTVWITCMILPENAFLLWLRLQYFWKHSWISKTVYYQQTTDHHIFVGTYGCLFAGLFFWHSNVLVNHHTIPTPYHKMCTWSLILRYLYLSPTLKFCA